MQQHDHTQPQPQQSQQQQQQHVGRRLADAVHGLRGQAPLRYDFEVVAHFAGELPPSVPRAALVWQRGAKALATGAEPANPHTRACFWGGQLLRQQATVYRDAATGAFLPKEYALKVVAMARDEGAGDAGAGAGAAPLARRGATVGRVKVDFARFCSADADPPPRELYLQLHPAGRLKVSVRAGWRKDAPLDADALTRSDGGGLERGGAASTQYTDGGGGGYYGGSEQDLGGFGGEDGGEGELAGGGGGGDFGPGGRRHASVSGRSTPAQLSVLGPQPQLGRLGLAPTPENGSGSPGAKEGRGPGSPFATIAAKRPNSQLARLPGEIAQFAVPLSAEEQRAEIERQKAAVVAAAQEHIAAMRRDAEAHFEAELERRLARARCCGLLSCCWPSARPRAEASADVGLSEPAAPAPFPLTTPDL